MDLGYLLANWPFLMLAILLGVGIYLSLMVSYYILFSEDVVIVQREGSLSRSLSRLVNPLRQALGKMPICDVPQDVDERQMVQVAVDCLAYVQRALRYGSIHGRAAANAANLRQIAHMLVANMVEALWRVQWSREIAVKLEHMPRYDTSARIVRIREIEKRDLWQVQRSFDAVVSLATRLAELGSQVRDSDVELLLAEFKEFVTQAEEDTEAWREVRGRRLR